MTLEIPEVRPAVISTELYSKLEEYLRFRHVIRNIYAFELDSSKLQALIDSKAIKMLKKLNAKLR